MSILDEILLHRRLQALEKEKEEEQLKRRLARRMLFEILSKQKSGDDILEEYDIERDKDLCQN